MRVLRPDPEAAPRVLRAMNALRRLNKLKAEFDRAFSDGLAGDGKTARLVAGCLELAGNPLPLTLFIICRESCGEPLA